jgi:hypothetical protein
MLTFLLRFSRWGGGSGGEEKRGASPLPGGVQTRVQPRVRQVYQDLQAQRGERDCSCPCRLPASLSPRHQQVHRDRQHLRLLPQGGRGPCCGEEKGGVSPLPGRVQTRVQGYQGLQAQGGERDYSRPRRLPVSLPPRHRQVHRDGVT